MGSGSEAWWGRCPGWPRAPGSMSGQRVDVKVVMLGKEYVGKTSLVERYVHDRFLVGPYQNVSAPLGAGAWEGAGGCPRA